MPRYRRKNDGCRIAIGKIGYITPGQVVSLPSIPKGHERFFDLVPEDHAATATLKPPARPLPSILPPEDRVTVVPDPQSPDSLVIQPVIDPAPTPEPSIPPAVIAAVNVEMNRHSNGNPNTPPPSPPRIIPVSPADISSLSVLVIGANDDEAPEASPESSPGPAAESHAEHEHEHDASEDPTEDADSTDASTDAPDASQQKRKRRTRRRK